MKLWGGRFNAPTNELVERFTQSITFDQQLARYDIMGSLAHVKTLLQGNLIIKSEAETLLDGLHEVLKDIQNNKVNFNIQDEDIHMNIERLLHAKIGSIAGKLHTGRSRNDQVVLDTHLYLREQIYQIVLMILNLQDALLEQTKQHIDTILPGYTHLQRAEPVRLAHHLLAYICMFFRDIERLINNFNSVNICPLGAGALAGSGVKVDRRYTAKLLKFNGIYTNSMDAVSNRDYLIEFHANAAILMVHLSRLGEELVLWSSQEFNFVTIDDAFCTGSSMMPQKKNPDVAELARAKNWTCIWFININSNTFKSTSYDV